MPLLTAMLFGKRRRGGQPTAPDEAPPTEAAPAGTEAAAAIPAPVPLDGEMAMPRWRRPSLLHARMADPAEDVAPIVTMSFADGATAAIDGFERRLIRYHVVELLGAPDELRSASIGSLSHGDEVQLLERAGTYWRVLCPDGREGWVHRMTLGETVAAGPPRPGPDG